MEPSAVTANGELICVHQKRVMVYNTKLNNWAQLGYINGGEEYAQPYSRYGFACASVGSNLYIIGGIREYSQNRYRYCTSLNTVEACELGGEKQYSSQLWWKLGAEMCQGGGVISASLVAWLWLITMCHFNSLFFFVSSVFFDADEMPPLFCELPVNFQIFQLAESTLVWSRADGLIVTLIQIQQLNVDYNFCKHFCSWDLEELRDIAMYDTGPRSMWFTELSRLCPHLLQGQSYSSSFVWYWEWYCQVLAKACGFLFFTRRLFCNIWELKWEERIVSIVE